MLVTMNIKSCTINQVTGLLTVKGDIVVNDVFHGMVQFNGWPDHNPFHTDQQVTFNGSAEETGQKIEINAVDHRAPTSESIENIPNANDVKVIPNPTEDQKAEIAKKRQDALEGKVDA